MDDVSSYWVDRLDTPDGNLDCQVPHIQQAPSWLRIDQILQITV